MVNMFGFQWHMVRLIFVTLWLSQYYSFGSYTLWCVLTGSCVCCLLVTLACYDHDYWVRKGVFSPAAWPLVGHIMSVVLFQEQGGIFFKKIYDAYPDKVVVGTHQFFQRTLVVRSPALIKAMCTQDFHHFVDRGFFFNPEVDPLAGSVLFLRGNEWRKLRTKISPIFSPSKIKGMLPLIEATADEFVHRVKKLIKNGKSDKHYSIIRKNTTKSAIAKENSVTVNPEKLLGGYTADAIVPCAFGLKSDVTNNPKDPFAQALHTFYEMTPFNLFEKTMRQFWPAFCLFFRLRIIPRRTHDFFYNIVTSVLAARESGLQERRGDFIDMMLALRHDGKNNNKSEEDDIEITDMLISANAFIIFLGGFETTSSTLAFLLLELAKHPCVQEKLRSEVLDILSRNDGKLTYDTLQDMTYMEMVIQETLRLYPPFPNIQRLCTKDYTLPGTNITVEKGTVVLFPTLAIQRDAQYFQDPDMFVPERFCVGAEQPPPGVYMPFGDGPRYCIGKRFAWAQMKVCLARLMAAGLHVTPVDPHSPRTQPFAPDPRSPLALHPSPSIAMLNISIKREHTSYHTKK